MLSRLLLVNNNKGGVKTPTTIKGYKMMTKKDYVKSQIESADTDFVNELLYEHYNNEVKNMDQKEFEKHLENIGLNTA
tara:strand:+ start:405 stop:638 length:234 start_codon:yes stop_codon:yes gene_type:complete